VIVRKLEVGPFATNCYIVGSESTKEGMIIDPADEAQLTLKNVKELGLDIKSIVLTHGHLDHIGALKKVKEATEAEVAIHSDDVNLLQDRLLGMLFGVFCPTPPPPDRLLKDGDSLDVGDLHFAVIHTPGHSPGVSVCWGMAWSSPGILYSIMA